jgi:hypothetical protein
VAPGAWNWPVGVVRAARRGLSLLPGAPGAEVMAKAEAVTAAWTAPGLLETWFSLLAGLVIL